jgi:hypothetical protein
MACDAGCGDADTGRRSGTSRFGSARGAAARSSGSHAAGSGSDRRRWLGRGWWRSDGASGGRFRRGLG